MKLAGQYSPEFSQLLDNLNISLMLSTYQAGKVILLSAKEGKIVQVARDFDRPMGIALGPDHLLALALRLNIGIFRDDATLAKTYPRKPDTYDALYFPIALNKTDFIDTHDIAFTRQGLVAVNTLYSCLVKVDGTFSFNPIWRPNFVTDYVAADQCHLNGMAVDSSGEIRYVTAFGKTNAAEGWRTNKLHGGIVIDVGSGEIIASGLGMPHSPRLYRGQLFVLSSATEELLRIDPRDGTIEPVAKIGGFIRGLAFVDRYAFIGTSKLRKSHAFGDLPIVNRRLAAGVTAVDLDSGNHAGGVVYGDSLQEIYDLQVIEGKRRPNILNLPLAEKYRAMLTPQGARWVETEESL